MKDYHQIIQKIYESANSEVYRAILKSDNQPVILKILQTNDHITLEQHCQKYSTTKAIDCRQL